MNINVNYDDNDADSEVIDIISVEYLGDFKLKIHFSDNHSSIVNFKPFLKKSLHPSIRKYLDETNFKQYSIIDGNINWNNYDMIFPIEDLYNSFIS